MPVLASSGSKALGGIAYVNLVVYCIGIVYPLFVVNEVVIILKLVEFRLSVMWPVIKHSSRYIVWIAKLIPPAVILCYGYSKQTT